MPIAMGSPGLSQAFYYGPEHQRIKQISSSQGTTYYLNPGNNGSLLFEKDIKPDNSTEQRNYITAYGQVVAMVKLTNGTTWTTRYMHRDNLGSVTAITDETGTVIERLAYEPFGKRRFATGSADPNNTILPQNTDRGFTNHEHLDELTLIHMNGRVYDPVAGRFMSADPHIQDPLNLQSYNRYAYVMNNPLGYTDPSGYFSLKKWIKPIAIAFVAWYTGGLVANAWAGTTAVGGAASSAMAAGTVGGVSTAGFASAAAGMAVQSTLSGALMYGAIQGATAGFVGGLLTSGGDVNYAFKSAMAGGITGGLTSFGNAGYGTVGRIAGQSLGAGINAQLNGGDFSSGLRYGFSGAMQGWAFDYMKGQTNGLALKYWGGDAHADANGDIWTYGGRGCGEKGSGAQCSSWLSALLMPSEAGGKPDHPDTWMKLGSIPFVGTSLNAISKVHDYMNNTLSVLWANGGSTLYGNGTSVRDYGHFGNGLVDVVSMAGMLPAAQVTAKALWQSPLRGR